VNCFFRRKTARAAGFAGGLKIKHERWLVCPRVLFFYLACLLRKSKSGRQMPGLDFLQHFFIKKKVRKKKVHRY